MSAERISAVLQSINAILGELFLVLLGITAAYRVLRREWPRGRKHLKGRSRRPRTNPNGRRLSVNG